MLAFKNFPPALRTRLLETGAGEDLLTKIFAAIHDAGYELTSATPACPDALIELIKTYGGSSGVEALGLHASVLLERSGLASIHSGYSARIICASAAGWDAYRSWQRDGLTGAQRLAIALLADRGWKTNGPAADQEIRHDEHPSMVIEFAAWNDLLNRDLVHGDGTLTADGERLGAELAPILQARKAVPAS